MKKIMLSLGLATMLLTLPQFVSAAPPSWSQKVKDTKEHNAEEKEIYQEQKKDMDKMHDEMHEDKSYKDNDEGMKKMRNEMHEKEHRKDGDEHMRKMEKE